MKKLLTIGLCLVFICASMSVKSQQEMTKEQKQSYAIGANMGQGITHDGVTIDIESFTQGVKDGIAGKNKFTDTEMQEIFTQLQQDLQAKKGDQATAEKAKGKAFLEENKKNKGVITTASGLQYKIVTMGKGPKPSDTSTVTVNYKGSLIDGTVFDSSEKQGKPISFPLNQVIPGWTEGVQLMPVGSKFIFYIPSELGYGDNGAGGVIPGGATLIFEIELLSIGNNAQ